ncbi:MAG TPA: hypothetical protein VJL28_07525 [Gemmatimonadaceae bacterium]|nr:hypothetical protein [Gemmatimonadaceae bacterium]
MKHGIEIIRVLANPKDGLTDSPLGKSAEHCSRDDNRLDAALFPGSDDARFVGWAAAGDRDEARQDAEQDCTRHESSAFGCPHRISFGRAGRVRQPRIKTCAKG